MRLRYAGLGLLLFGLLTLSGCGAYAEFNRVIDEAKKTAMPTAAQAVKATLPPATAAEAGVKWLLGSDARAESPAPQAPAYRLVVDLGAQVVLAYPVAGAEEPEKVFLCSTGAEGSPTPTGDYLLDGPEALWAYFPEQDCYARYPVRMGRLYFHSVPYSAPEEAALSRAAWDKLGSRTSHGDIRLFPEDAKWLYENCPAGTECEIRQGSMDEALRAKAKRPDRPE